MLRQKSVEIGVLVFLISEKVMDLRQVVAFSHRAKGPVETIINETKIRQHSCVSFLYHIGHFGCNLE